MGRHLQTFSATGTAQRSAPTTGSDSARTLPNEMRQPAADEITKIVHGVFLVHRNGNTPRAVAFCGVNPGVGTTWVCARTGESLAEASSATVCLIDANPRSPSLHAELGAPNHPGFSDMMQSSRPVEEYAQKIAPTAWLVASGGLEKPVSAPLNANSLVQRFLELRDAFDILLIDTPAVSVWPDALLLGRVIDGVVMVVGSASSRRETARKVKTSFEGAQIPVLGAVLNRRTFPIPGAIYRNI